MGRPSKSTEVLENEKKSHRTKAEIGSRKAEEKAALTGIRMRESTAVKADPVAHREYLRVKKILNAAGKNDALYESVINDYCMYKSDIERYREMREELRSSDMTADTKYIAVLKCDSMIEKYQKKRFDIEKENGMTIASSARSIPKKAQKSLNPLEGILNGDD